jgi:hypothetical protein
MSSETDYLNRMLSEPSALSMTFTTTQHPRQRPGPPIKWEPGLAEFGWRNVSTGADGPTAGGHYRSCLLIGPPLVSFRRMG